MALRGMFCASSQSRKASQPSITYIKDSCAPEAISPTIHHRKKKKKYKIPILKAMCIFKFVLGCAKRYEVCLQEIMKKLNCTDLDNLHVLIASMPATHTNLEAKKTKLKAAKDEVVKAIAAKETAEKSYANENKYQNLKFAHANCSLDIDVIKLKANKVEVDLKVAQDNLVARTIEFNVGMAKLDDVLKIGSHHARESVQCLLVDY